MSSTVRINAQIAIPRDELRFSFVRSSGPGGQNVNKVASKAVLCWSVGDSFSIPQAVRERFLKRYSRRINDRRVLVITSQRYRDQSRNIDDCLAKLREMVLSVASAPVPRKKTRIPKAVKERRLREKRATADKKQNRRKPPTAEQ